MCCTIIYFREIVYTISWYAWILTYDYSPQSVTFLADVIYHILWSLSGTLLYLFFVFRLYAVYKSDFNIKPSQYIVLLILVFIYFVALSGTAIFWFDYNNVLYSASNGLCLVLEISMTIIVMILFSNPIIMISISQEKHKICESPKFVSKRGNKDKKNGKKEDKLLALLTKLLILSMITMMSSIIVRICTLSSFLISEEEWWLTHVVWSTWSVDSFINVFCIFASFGVGNKYYQKCCDKLHKRVSDEWIHKYIDNKLSSVENMAANTINISSMTRENTIKSISSADDSRVI